MSHKRLGEILTVFGRVGLTHLKEKKTPFEEQETPVKLRLAFELLGPSFVKIGQIHHGNPGGGYPSGQFDQEPQIFSRLSR